MNITHAKEEKIEGDKLKAIFTRQKELMEKYHHIEAASGLCQTEDCPINLDDKRGQARIKDFAWRVTEELGEALDAREDSEHYQEELIDGLHFLTELTILAGKDYNTILHSHYIHQGEGEDTLGFLFKIGPKEDLPLSSRVRIFIESLAMMCNCLKNKPWKQSHMQTDKEAFYSRLEQVWRWYIAILDVSGLTAESTAMVYLKKAQVNAFRQRSNY